jgi:hemolysin III
MTDRPPPVVAVGAAAPAPEARPDEDEHGETLLEEIANAVSHGIGAGLAVAGLVMMVVVAAGTGSARATVGAAIFGAMLFVMFLASTLYHSVGHRRKVPWLLAADHCAIFLLIAGTYTPIALVILPGGPGWLLFGLIWGLAAIGIALRLFWLRYLHPLFIGIYLAMGWLGFFYGDRLRQGLGEDGMGLILIGGLFYTLGLVFYVLRRVPYNHTLWHLSVLAGAIFHFFAVLHFVLPKAA